MNKYQLTDFNHSVSIELKHLENEMHDFQDGHDLASDAMLINRIFVDHAYESQNTSKRDTKSKKYEEAFRRAGDLPTTHKVYSISSESETRFHYHQCERTEHALGNHPVVKKFYEVNDPDAVGWTFMTLLLALQFNWDILTS